MNIIATLGDNWKKRRSRIFSFLALLFTVVFMIVGTFEFIPAWIMRDPADLIHLWHIAELTAIAVVLGSAMFGLVRRAEEKPLLAQFIVISTIILAIGIAPFFMPAIGLLLLAGLLVLAYPKPRALFSFAQKGRISIALLAITAPLAVILAPIILQEIHYQIIGMSENDAHALLLHWIGSALLYVMLILAGVLASTKRPGWKWLGIITGLTYCYLGVIGLIVPGYAAGAWSEAGGLFALFFGAMYILITLAEAEGMSLETSMSGQKSEQQSESVAESVAEASFDTKSTSVSFTLHSHEINGQNEKAELQAAHTGGR
jgi:hypothetical protein